MDFEENNNIEAEHSQDEQAQVEEGKAAKKKSKEKKSEENSSADLVVSNDPATFPQALTDIKKELKVIAERQSQRVSPEFTALMDGYVTKANESETLRAKYLHIESHFEELKQELKTQKSSNKQLISDLDATREALKLSELDINKYKRDLEQVKEDYDRKLEDLESIRASLHEKVNELTAWKEASENKSNEMKSEILEFKHKIKQLEQERNIESETAKRTIRENNKIVDELKEQLELREREASYKNALLEQMIRQTSQSPGSNGSDVASNLGFKNLPQMESNVKKNSSPISQDSSKTDKPEKKENNEFNFDNSEPKVSETNHESSESSESEALTAAAIPSDAAKDSKQRFSWGAFRK